VEPTPIVPHDQVLAMLDVLSREAKDVVGVALMGTSPVGAPHDVYGHVASACRGRLLLLDGYKDILPVLDLRTVTILKINASELSTLMLSLSLPCDVKDSCSIAAAASTLASCFDIAFVAVTRGCQAAVLVQRSMLHAFWEIFPPAFPAEEVMNPIGAGDTVAGVLLSLLARTVAAAPALATEPVAYEGSKVAAAFSAGLAAGSASCNRLKGADFAREDIAALLRPDTGGVTTIRTKYVSN
jgi:fructose-1-phosphate kinase PfkB-like protein